MTVRFDAAWSYRGFQALVLENALLRAVILPELGAKIWSLTFKPRDREMLWHNPRIVPRPAPLGARYDDWFCGGWDELFPNDAPVVIDGEAYPDHGELWSMPFTWEVAAASPDETTIRFSCPGTVTASRFEKWLTLRADEPTLRIRYRIENSGPLPLDFHWKLHPALRHGDRARVDLPATRVVVDDNFAAEFRDTEFNWPQATGADDAAIDMRRLPPYAARTARFFYAVELTDGWCALTDDEERVGFGLVFDPAILSTVWVFGSYGGWRGLQTTILEPCTGYPFELDKAIAGGRHSHLEPGEAIDTEVLAVVYEGRTEVQRIGRDGEVS
jgi:hypothetical protein